jgi:hypothetical protein
MQIKYLLRRLIANDKAVPVPELDTKLRVVSILLAATGLGIRRLDNQSLARGTPCEEPGI